MRNGRRTVWRQEYHEGVSSKPHYLIWPRRRGRHGEKLKLTVVVVDGISPRLPRGSAQVCRRLSGGTAPKGHGQDDQEDVGYGLCKRLNDDQDDVDDDEQPCPAQLTGMLSPPAAQHQVCPAAASIGPLRMALCALQPREVSGPCPRLPGMITYPRADATASQLSWVYISSVRFRVCMVSEGHRVIGAPSSSY